MLDKKIINGVLVFDIESANPYYGCPTEEHKFRLFACYSFDDQKSYMLYDPQEIRDIIERHKYIISFNGVGFKYKNEIFSGYDCNVMFHSGFSDIINKGFDDLYRFKGKINIDMFAVFKKRASAMKVKEGMLHDLLMRFSLDFISQTIGITDKDSGKIKGFDYGLLIPEVKDWAPENKKLIEEYTQRDITITTKMYIWIEEYFESFKDYLNEEDIDKKTYLTSSIAVFAYKSVCNALGYKEEYSDDKSGSKYNGAVVAFPSGEDFHGHIYALDFTSLYPHLNVMANLYSPVAEGQGWHGNKMFHPVGTYNDKKRGKIELFLLDLYNKRLQMKAEGSSKQYSAKILLNSLYGISANPVFKKLYNKVTAADCTNLGRTCIKFARKTFIDNGYKLLALDTDSNYILDPFDDKEKILKLRDYIVTTIKDNLPLPSDTFGMELEAEITDMFFTKPEKRKKKITSTFIDEEDEKNSKLGFLKKNYIYRTTDGKVVYKGMGVKKKSSPEVCRYIFKNILLKKISEERVARFSEKYLQTLITDLLKKDLSMATIRYACKPVGMYASESNINAQISKVYGPGIHFMIPVKKDVYDDSKLLTAGMSKKYISLENFQKLNLKLSDIDMESIYSGLAYFIKDNQTALTQFIS